MRSCPTPTYESTASWALLGSVILGVLMLAASVALSRWLISRALSVVVGLIGGYPMLRAVHAGQVHGGGLIEQLVLSAVVLGGYLFIAGNIPQ